MKIPNLASLNHAGVGRLSTESHEGAYSWLDRRLVREDAPREISIGIIRWNFFIGPLKKCQTGFKSNSGMIVLPVTLFIFEQNKARFFLASRSVANLSNGCEGESEGVR